MKLMLDVKIGIYPFTVFRGWDDPSMWHTFLDKLTMFGEDPPEISLVFQTVLDCHQSYITALTELNAYMRALNQAVFKKGHWNFDIQIFKNMVSACNQAGGSKRKKTYHEGRNVDVDTSTVTNLHEICAGLETNHNLLNDSSVMIGDRISDKALTLALQSQRQEELNDNGGVSAIGDHLSKLINLQLINYDQVVAAVSIFESSTIAASLFLKTKDVLEKACLVKKMVDRQAKHGKN